MNQFVNLAVAHLQHEEWLARRPKASPASIIKTLEILDRPTPHAPKEEDKLPKNYPTTRSGARK